MRCIGNNNAYFQQITSPPALIEDEPPKLSQDAVDSVYKQLLEYGTDGYTVLIYNSMANFIGNKWTLSKSCPPLEYLFREMGYDFEISATPVSENANREGTTPPQE